MHIKISGFIAVCALLLALTGGLGTALVFLIACWAFNLLEA